MHHLTSPSTPAGEAHSKNRDGRTDIPIINQIPLAKSAELRWAGSRHATVWTGYVVHLSETCEDDAVHLISSPTR
jgi:hypothetical protein